MTGTFADLLPKLAAAAVRSRAPGTPTHAALVDVAGSAVDAVVTASTTTDEVVADLAAVSPFKARRIVAGLTDPQLLVDLSGRDLPAAAAAAVATHPNLPDAVRLDLIRQHAAGADTTSILHRTIGALAAHERRLVITDLDRLICQVRACGPRGWQSAMVLLDAAEADLDQQWAALTRIGSPPPGSVQKRTKQLVRAAHLRLVAMVKAEWQLHRDMGRLTTRVRQFVVLIAGGVSGAAGEFLDFLVTVGPDAADLARQVLTAPVGQHMSGGQFRRWQATATAAGWDLSGTWDGTGAIGLRQLRLMEAAAWPIEQRRAGAAWAEMRPSVHRPLNTIEELWLLAHPERAAGYRDAATRSRRQAVQYVADSVWTDAGVAAPALHMDVAAATASLRGVSSTELAECLAPTMNRMVDQAVAAGLDPHQLPAFFRLVASGTPAAKAIPAVIAVT